MDKSITDSKILWCLNLCTSGMCYNPRTPSIHLMKRMFPDLPDITHRMSLSYHLELLLQGCCRRNYVIYFDEALNKILQKGQTDIRIRFFNIERVRLKQDSPNILQVRIF